MSVQIETVELIEPWIYSTMWGDDDLRTLVGDSISGTLAPAPLTPPYVTFLMQSSLDVNTAAGGDRITTDNLYMIKGVTAGAGWDAAVPIASRLSALFHLPNRTVNVPGGSLVSIRQQIVEYPEVDAGIQYRHLGGIFRIRASAD